MDYTPVVRSPWHRELQYYNVVILMLYNLYFQCYFSDIEALEACFRLLHVM